MSSSFNDGFVDASFGLGDDMFPAANPKTVEESSSDSDGSSDEDSDSDLDSSKSESDSESSKSESDTDSDSNADAECGSDQDLGSDYDDFETNPDAGQDSDADEDPESDQPKPCNLLINEMDSFSCLWLPLLSVMQRAPADVQRLILDTGKTADETLPEILETHGNDDNVQLSADIEKAFDAVIEKTAMDSTRRYTGKCRRCKRRRNKLRRLAAMANLDRGNADEATQFGRILIANSPPTSHCQMIVIPKRDASLPRLSKAKIKKLARMGAVNHVELDNDAKTNKATPVFPHLHSLSHGNEERNLDGRAPHDGPKRSKTGPRWNFISRRQWLRYIDNTFPPSKSKPNQQVNYEFEVSTLLSKCNSSKRRLHEATEHLNKMRKRDMEYLRVEEQSKPLTPGSSRDGVYPDNEYLSSILWHKLL